MELERENNQNKSNYGMQESEAIVTIEHLFFYSPNVEMIWKVAPLRWEGLIELQCNLWRWWEVAMLLEDKAQGLNRINLTSNIL